jgi:hypothetical protein
MGTHPSTHHPSIKTGALFGQSLAEKNSNMVFNKVLTIGFFPVAISFLLLFT